VLLEDPGKSKEDMVGNITSMSMDEFDQYIYDAVCNSSAEEATFEENNIPYNFVSPVVTSEGIGIKSVTVATQRYYYDNLGNYLYIKAQSTRTSRNNGTTVYTGLLQGYGSSVASYPAYVYNSMNYSFSTDKRLIYCTWKCTKYASANVAYATRYTIKTTFLAGGGDAR